MNYINISLVCCKNKKTWLKNFKVEQGITSGELLQKAKEFADCPIEINSELPLGVFSKRVDHSYTLQDGDRLEVYQPLILTPAEARLLRAELQKKK